MKASFHIYCISQKVISQPLAAFIRRWFTIGWTAVAFEHHWLPMSLTIGTEMFAELLHMNCTGFSRRAAPARVWFAFFLFFLKRHFHLSFRLIFRDVEQWPCSSSTWPWLQQIVLILEQNANPVRKTDIMYYPPAMDLRIQSTSKSRVTHHGASSPLHTAQTKPCLVTGVIP